ncbi:glycosyltransferase [Paraburkholderia sp. CNPSo 3281]|uniref:glycosyltransferase n=1 Tax=Paraburkholderia sp. CNPSo 3281 TaxID=2940933 RepID=UPI0020B7CDDC|nr:glycosyltransferase [Paraburkholderia sp. CNPSo 3281]MCP3718736.1 glycosyltransferase [Paraburkholderia sp. CNPSo 3281]
MQIEAALSKTLLAIPSINGGRLLERMLPTLRIPAELVVVLDQGSTDHTEEVCRKAGVGFVQLGRAHTYTEACNIGARMAAERGCEFVFVGNNDIAFTTDVIRELLAELQADPNLGIVAPAQMLVDEAAGIRRLAYRVYWDLETLSFTHDFMPPCGHPLRLEADFCELTLAGVRMSAIEKIGFLDDDYGFYHEDADFGFRLRDAGYTCAYLPNSQIEHWTSSTFSTKPSEFKLNYLRKNKKLFAQKFLGHYVAHQDHKSDATNSWNIINKHLHPYLRKYGLVHPDAAELIFSHPGTEPFGYLYSVWETTRIPEAWLAFRDRYKLVLNPSRWNVDVYRQAGFKRVHYMPLGVESDVFQPWGAAQRFTDGKTFLWFSHNQYRKGLDVMLKAWAPFHRAQPGARLILMGAGLISAMRAPASTYVWKNFRVAEYPDEGISVYENLTGMDNEALATIYRSVDFTVCSSRSEGFGFSVAESMACGTPAIFGNFGATADFVIPGALTLDGTPIVANYSDKGFGDVGNWWEPSTEQLTSRLFEASTMDAVTYQALAESGVRTVRTGFSWREASLAMRRALIAEDEGRLLTADGRTGGAMPLPQPLGLTPPGQTTSRVRGIVARGMRRTGFLLSFFAENLEPYGWRYASSVASSRLLAPYLKTRKQWLRQRLAQRKSAQQVAAATQVPLASDEKRHGVLFIGYAEGALGLGQAFRANLKAAEAAGLPFAVYPFRVGIETRLLEAFMPQRYDMAHRYKVNFIEVACDQMPVVVKSLNPKLLDGAYNILCPYWELPRAPEEWRANLTNIQEIWAPNTFIAEAFAQIFDGPIVVIPPAMEDTGGDHPGRAHFGMEEGRFYFMFSFDYYSSPFRKNPLGVLRAFQQAFPRGDERVGLVIKSTGAPNHFPDVKATIEQAMKSDPRIVLFDRNMPRDEMLGLIRSSDAYVSLHRAEGFGLGMAEAMTFERIIIGTDFSGSTDFLTEETGYPVPYQLRAVQQHEYPWSAGQVWAEPDVDEAANIMRRVVKDPSEGEARRRTARERIERTYKPEVVGMVMRGRLEVLLKKSDPNASHD